jgi:hypothetical protein
MNKITQNIVLYGSIALAIGSLTFLAFKLFRKKEILVKGEYSVPEGTPNRVDALHSFESRKSDGFGGRMLTKIEEAMKKLYNRGINPDVKDIKINVDSNNYKVTWSANVVPSQDGKAYIGMSSVGSAGTNADARALSQIAQMKTKVEGAEDYTLVLDFKNPSGVYIRQFFYKHTIPNKYPHKK